MVKANDLLIILLHVVPISCMGSDTSVTPSTYFSAASLYAGTNRSAATYEGSPAVSCSSQSFKAFSSWVDRSSLHGEHVFGTAWTQANLYEHQHPPNCRKATFYVLNFPRSNGIGSTIHVIGAHLALAVELGRVLLLAPAPNDVWLQGAYCQGATTLDTCFFEPLSNCSMADALATQASLPVRK
jgi:hypothetical protein